MTGSRCVLTFDGMTQGDGTIIQNRTLGSPPRVTPDVQITPRANCDRIGRSPLLVVSACPGADQREKQRFLGWLSWRVARVEPSVPAETGSIRCPGLRLEDLLLLGN